MGGPTSSTTAESYMQAHEQTAITTALHSLKVWEQIADVYSILKSKHLEKRFYHISNLHQNIKFTMTEERCKESVVSSLFNRAYSIIISKEDLTKEKIE